MILVQFEQSAALFLMLYADMNDSDDKILVDLIKCNLLIYMKNKASDFGALKFLMLTQHVILNLYIKFRCMNKSASRYQILKSAIYN